MKTPETNSLNRATWDKTVEAINRFRKMQSNANEYDFDVYDDDWPKLNIDCFLWDGKETLIWKYGEYLLPEPYFYKHPESDANYRILIIGNTKPWEFYGDDGKNFRPCVGLRAACVGHMPIKYVIF